MARAEREQAGADLAVRYAERSQLLREALEVPSGENLQLRPLAQGEHNSNFLLVHPVSAERFVLRINFASQLGLAEQAAYEFGALELLRATGRAPLPVLCDESRQVIGKGLLVESFCEGERMDYARPGDLRAAAAILADIHAAQPPADCPLMRPEDPLRAQWEEARGLFDAYAASPFADAAAVGMVEEMFQTTEAALAQVPPADGRASIVNTEAVRMHFLLPHDAEGAVRGGCMVDWEKPILGEPAQDVAYFLSPTTTIWDAETVFDEETRRCFVEEYRRCVDGRFPLAAFEARFEAYAMTNCLRGIAWSANAIVEYHDPARPLKNERTRRKLGEYVDHRFLEHVLRDRFRAS